MRQAERREEDCGSQGGTLISGGAASSEPQLHAAVLVPAHRHRLVALARALLADPQVLVMDEATSSVDAETEQRIQRALQEVVRHRTCFVIAHRLSTVRSADRILVVEAGRLAEQGRHAELLARRGPYHRLYTQQRLRDDAAVAGWSSARPAT